MDRLEEVNNRFSPNQGYAFHTKALSDRLGDCVPLFYGLSLDDIEYLFSEIETLRMDNTYLQQRLQREVEKE